ncbi:MAG TPA: DsbA family protein [Ilumatobacteraceae bacterium]|nr:DsbA family protein [Ilumatobacteraceae bacterium]
MTDSTLPELTTVDFHFDVMCPWAYRTSWWMRTVRDELGLQVNWKFFSLEEINRVEGKKHPWEREWSYGWSMMRIGALLRRTDMALLEQWYERAGHALHIEGRKPHDPAVARELLADLGIDPAVVDQAIADPTTHDDVKADHDRVVGLGGFGVPTIVFPGDRALYGPVVLHPPTGAEAIRLWNLFTGFLEFPTLYEIKHPHSADDQRQIVEAFRPYVEARDWVSIDRGKVIPLSLAPRDGGTSQ